MFRDSKEIREQLETFESGVGETLDHERHWKMHEINNHKQMNSRALMRLQNTVNSNGPNIFYEKES